MSFEYGAGHDAGARAAQVVYRWGPRLLAVALVCDLAGLVAAVVWGSTGWIVVLSLVLAVDVMVNVRLWWKRRRSRGRRR